jgi:RND family efflux transporter MFP subunit
MKKFITAFLAISLSAGGISYALYVSRTTEATGGGPPPPEPLLVEVVEAAIGPIQKEAHFVASVEAASSVVIVPKLTGLLSEIKVDLGDFVEEGALLAVIEDDEFHHQAAQAEAELALSQAQLSQRKISLETAKREMDRAERAKNQGVSTEQQWENARATWELAQAEVTLVEAEKARAEAVLAEARTNLANTNILAPQSGYVDKRRVEPGTLVSSNTPLLTLVKVDPVEVVLSLPQRDLDLAGVGRTATVQVAGSATTHTGTIVQVAPTIDVASRTSAVIVRVENPERALMPGMSVNVVLIAEAKEDVVRIPEGALMQEGDQARVMRVVDDKVELADINVGVVARGIAEVVSGIAPGDLVITKGHYMVEAGDEVRHGDPVPL